MNPVKLISHGRPQGGQTEVIQLQEVDERGVGVPGKLLNIVAPVSMGLGDAVMKVAGSPFTIAFVTPTSEADGEEIVKAQDSAPTPPNSAGPVVLPSPASSRPLSQRSKPFGTG